MRKNETYKFKAYSEKANFHELIKDGGGKYKVKEDLFKYHFDRTRSPEQGITHINFWKLLDNCYVDDHFFEVEVTIKVKGLQKHEENLKTKQFGE